MRAQSRPLPWNSLRSNNARSMGVNEKKKNRSVGALLIWWGPNNASKYVHPACPSPHMKNERPTGAQKIRICGREGPAVQSANPQASQPQAIWITLERKTRGDSG